MVLSFSAPLFGDPVIDITGTMDKGDAFCLACCEEANDIQVDQAYFVQVQRDARPSGLYLRFQFFYMLPPHAANKSYRRTGSIRMFLDPQGHVRFSPVADLNGCTLSAIWNSPESQAFSL